MSSADSISDRRKDTIRRELETARSDFHELLDSLSDEGWERQSLNPAWTNGQLLFHITLGFGLIPTLMPLVQLFGRFPRGYSRPFASLLNGFTPLFNRVNAIAPLIGVRIYPRESLGKKFDSVLDAIVKRLDRTEGQEWESGMYAPIKWEPRFAEYMKIEDFFRYPVVHFRHHKTQFVAEQERRPR